YVYEKADASPVIVTYVDSDGNELATPETLSGKIGDPYTTNAKAIYGWAVTVTPENAQGTFSEEAQTVTYVYEKADASPVIVTYVDSDGNELATPETLSGKIGDPYTTNAKEIYGWTVTTTPENAQGTFSEEAQTVTYVYEKADASPVTVTYVDTEGNELATPETLSGKIGDPYTTNAKEIYGWAVTVTPENAQGTFSEEAQTVTYVYEKADASPVIVTYVDTEGNELATPETLSGKIGDPYTTNAKEIYGWTVTTTPENAQGTFSEEAQTVTYVYEKADASPVTVTYVDTEGNELAIPETLSGKIGETYTTNAKEIYGWTVTTIPENAQGTFSEEAQTVTYIYEKNASASKPSSVDNSKSNSNHTSTVWKKENVKNLPQTGETTTWTGTIIGGLMVLATSIITFTRKKKRVSK
ncbi:MucBP domain-containing protein, partial [Enterococcus innesii]|uniref:MucBP domain-containing protein n=1 Tax=Enterococcus innesii TaxID=2839759 RepID=UPI0039852B7E